MPGESSHDLTRVLEAINAGDPRASDDLLPVVYEQLRRLAERQMAGEVPGHTLQPTALVHEAYLRLVGDHHPGWSSRGHFYAAAAQAMRRILVERARRYGRIRHGAGRRRVPLAEADPAVEFDEQVIDFIALDQALDELQKHDARLSEIVLLRYFAGLSVDETARALGVSPRTVRREWSYARLWLFEQISGREARAPREHEGEADER